MITVYVCNNCNAQVKEKKPERCPLCGKNEFTKCEKEPEKKDESGKVFEETIKRMEEKDKELGHPDTMIYEE